MTRWDRLKKHLTVARKTCAAGFAGRMLFGMSAAVWSANPVQAQTSFAPLAERLMPTVVNISTQRENIEDEPGIINDLIFDLPGGRAALGSGFVVTSDGYIATNRHVIENAGKITVIDADNVEYEAFLAGEDRQTDIALIKVETSKPLVAAEFGNSDKIKVGDWVLAIGNPFGLGSSVTAGIISAKARHIESGSPENYLQTDASINQGNSGGPMFDMAGKLVGMNTAIFSTTGNSVGVGFALPSNQVEWVIGQLRRHGKVQRSWLGVAVKQGETPQGLKGLVLTALKDENLARANNLQIGDIILQVEGQNVPAPQDFAGRISRMAPGETIRLKIWRDGQTSSQDVKVELDESTFISGLNNLSQTENASQFSPSKEENAKVVRQKPENTDSTPQQTNSPDHSQASEHTQASGHSQAFEHSQPSEHAQAFAAADLRPATAARGQPRDGKEEAIVQQRSPATAAKGQPRDGQHYRRLGLTLKGLAVVAVDKGSVAELYGVKPGDVILKAGNKPVLNSENLQFYFEDSLMSRQPLRLEFEDSAQPETYFVEFMPEENPDRGRPATGQSRSLGNLPLNHAVETFESQPTQTENAGALSLGNMPREDISGTAGGEISQ